MTTVEIIHMSVSVALLKTCVQVPYLSKHCFPLLKNKTHASIISLIKLQDFSLPETFWDAYRSRCHLFAQVLPESQ